MGFLVGKLLQSQEDKHVESLINDFSGRGFNSRHLHQTLKFFFSVFLFHSAVILFLQDEYSEISYRCY